MEIKCRLNARLCCRDSHTCLEFTKEITLPFVPTPGMWLSFPTGGWPAGMCDFWIDWATWHIAEQVLELEPKDGDSVFLRHAESVSSIEECRAKLLEIGFTEQSQA